MSLLEIPIQLRIYVGIAAMMVLFASFIIAMVIGQRKKLQYHKDRQRLMQEQQDLLAEQNKQLEQRVAKRTLQLEEKNKALEVTLTDLKNTQEQLIQREKLASLGELTAGIAHEIKNPLNFVNNFSEVSVELLDELKEAWENKRLDEAGELTEELQSNLHKIALHGKRADSIVKAMLSHARTGSGLKEMTDINALADECLKLSYQGQRARVKNFNVSIETALDASLPYLPVNEQEISRVLINLCNNAFYAVMEKQSLARAADYTPTVTMSTRQEDNHIVIEVKDNGMGIDKAIMSKIFQPFFTTKPTGEGTGLGLSMSHEIIAQGHRGKLEVSTEPGEWTLFTISLPIRP